MKHLMNQQNNGRNPFSDFLIQAKQLQFKIGQAVATVLVFMMSSLNPNHASAQLLLPASSAETQYPDISMTPTSLNLDPRFTKYLSNFAYPGTGPLTGSTIELTGWSTDNDGGFSYGTSTFGVYTGIGAMTIPNAREVQVGYLEFTGGHSYIMASYYNVTRSQYGYDLYSWDLVTNAVAKIYSYHFTNPNTQVPEYTPTIAYHPSHPGSTYPVFPPPPAPSTMAYNRISMDISDAADKVIIVLTDHTTGFMYTAAGMISLDTVLFSPSLPITPVYPPVTLTPLPAIEPPVYHFPYPATPGYVSGGGGTYFEYFDSPTGIYARYDVASTKYYYSYYPLDQWIYVSEYDGTTITRLASNSAFSPLIRLKAVSSVTTPCINPYYKQYWPDVAFTGNEMQYVFYAPELNDLYVTDGSWISSGGLPAFSDLYSFTGNAVTPTSCLNGITDLQIGARNTVDGRYISSDFIVGLGHMSHESSVESLPPTTDVPEIRAKIDAPDLASTQWAIAFAYKPDNFYAIPYTPFTIVHDFTEIGKQNIYVRSNFVQSILTNGSLGNFAINIEQNIAPTIAYKPFSANADIAWASERVGLLNGTVWGYAGVELNTTTSALVSFNDYLLLANTPTLSCGDNPLVALSKHTNSLNELYNCFTQEDISGTYSVQHKDHPWASTASWRKTDPTVIAPLVSEKISVGPNPFTNTLHVQSAEIVSLQLMDIMGRMIAKYNGSASEVNKQLDAKAAQLSTGNYLLKVNTISGKQEVFKLSKQ
jgi:hypothetical protein